MPVVIVKQVIPIVIIPQLPEHQKSTVEGLFQIHGAVNLLHRLRIGGLDTDLKLNQPRLLS